MNVRVFGTLTITATLIQLSASFLFPGLGGGGGGCGCCPPPPPPPPPCIMLPQIQLPQPCIPPIMLPSLPSIPMCGCGRKKRAANATELFTGNEPTCTDPELRKLILKNIQNDLLESRNAIAQAANTHFNQTGEFVAVCTPGKMDHFATTFDTYCVDGSPQQTCYLFKMD
uniref:Ground-like domain-containing protein n=1 Tax=Steinernema glaseri TaxID=37863 RepID=A0A1I7Y850_9BILA